MNNAGDVKTVVEMGWGGVKNGALLVLAAKEFDAFLTVDKSLPYQQNLGNLPVAVIVLEASSNELSALIATRSQPGASTWRSAALHFYAGWGITLHGENKGEAF